MNGFFWRTGDEVAWSGEQNRSGRGKAGADRLKRARHHYSKSHKREKDASANHTQKTGKHTPLQLIRMMESR